MPSSTAAATAAHLSLLAVLSSLTLFCLYKSRRPKPRTTPTPKLIYLSQTGTSKTLATRLHTLLRSHNLPFDLVNASQCEPEDLCKETLVVIIASTWDDGNPPETGRFLYNWVEESKDDFRVGAMALSEVKFAVFGVGSGVYGEERFNKVGKGLVKGLKELGAVEVAGMGEGDVDDGLDEVFERWSREVVERLKKKGSLGNGSLDEDLVCESEEEEYEEEEEEEEEGVVDLEDIAGKGPTRRTGAEFNKKVNGKADGEKEMVTLVIRASLEKQVGSAICF